MGAWGVTPESLDLVPTEDIVDALARRYEKGVLVVGTSRTDSNDDTTELWHRHGVPVALGLATWAQNRLLPERRRS